MHDPNRELLLLAARQLRPLLNELVFVGGCMTGLLITDEANPNTRVTTDVDTIVGITSYTEYVDFGQRLRGVGFSEDMDEGAPLCRWKHGSIILDVMPLDEKVLGFSNRWYPEAMAAAQTVILEPSLQIRSITAPFFLATKLDAFTSRGKRDYLISRDLEDVLAVIDGRPSLMRDLSGASDDLRGFLQQEMSALLRDPDFIGALAGHLPPSAAGQARLPILLQRIKDLAKLR